jgi:hypothetical protein
MHSGLPVEAGIAKNIGYRLRRLWWELRCEHTHTFVWLLPADAQWESEGKRMGPHKTLRLRGCYLCGRIWVEDWGA